MNPITAFTHHLPTRQILYPIIVNLQTSNHSSQTLRQLFIYFPKQVPNDQHPRVKSLASINPSTSSQQYHLPTMSDTESPTPAPTPTCPLLKCPPEIRNRIWTFVVKVEKIKIRCNTYRKIYRKHLPPTTMALAFTCRQIYREVTPIYYSANLFCFPSGPIDSLRQLKQLRQFAAAIGPENAKSISAMGFPRYFQSLAISRELQKALLPYPNLKILSYFDTDVFEPTRQVQILLKR